MKQKAGPKESPQSLQSGVQAQLPPRATPRLCGPFAKLLPKLFAKLPAAKPAVQPPAKATGAWPPPPAGPCGPAGGCPKQQTAKFRGTNNACHGLRCAACATFFWLGTVLGAAHWRRRAGPTHAHGCWFGCSPVAGFDSSPLGPALSPLVAIDSPHDRGVWILNFNYSRKPQLGM